ncbi:hypothetical protein [Rhizobium sp. NZLR11]|uniref:hypothetical protein n=1 Tax=Rhizobium sp. NZLR11 TaxID=2731098 RepID=UPI001C8292F9|nr:hypothetical protein [Rhizobium sp. NZLR11]MBX5206736.1 hypothetical protein [Rhizobium sp. NZLR11]
MTTPTDAHERALSAAWRECSAWDGNITPAVLRKAIGAYLREIGSDRQGIYIASKTKHAERWRILRHLGEPIISTWIDEAGAGESSDLADLWRRCIAEASAAQVLILYREPEDVLKGGWVELGAALASGVPVFAVGIEEFTVSYDTRIRHFPDMGTALAAARQQRAALASPVTTEREGGT